MRKPFLCWKRAAWWSRATTPTCRSRPACSPPCGASRLASARRLGLERRQCPTGKATTRWCRCKRLKPPGRVTGRVRLGARLHGFAQCGWLQLRVLPLCGGVARRGGCLSWLLPPGQTSRSGSVQPLEEFFTNSCFLSVRWWFLPLVVFWVHRSLPTGAVCFKVFALAALLNAGNGPGCQPNGCSRCGRRSCGVLPLSQGRAGGADGESI